MMVPPALQTLLMIHLFPSLRTSLLLQFFLFSSPIFLLFFSMAGIPTKLRGIHCCQRRAIVGILRAHFPETQLGLWHVERVGDDGEQQKRRKKSG